MAWADSGHWSVTATVGIPAPARSRAGSPASPVSYPMSRPPPSRKEHEGESVLLPEDKPVHLAMVSQQRRQFGSQPFRVQGAQGAVLRPLADEEQIFCNRIEKAIETGGHLLCDPDDLVRGDSLAILPVPVDGKTGTGQGQGPAGPTSNSFR